MSLRLRQIPLDSLRIHIARSLLKDIDLTREEQEWSYFKILSYL